MANDTSIIRLLYAIISQKCLRDIDWERVAQDPILSREISNGHAARMRFSRFKKQMETTTSAHKPRKSRVNKSSRSSSQTKTRKREGTNSRNIKLEAEQDNAYNNSFTSSGSSNSARDMQTPDPVTGMSVSGYTLHNKSDAGHLSHHGMYAQADAQLSVYQPATPHTTLNTPTHHAPYRHEGSASPSPNASFHAAALGMNDIEESIHGSFYSHGSELSGTFSSGMVTGGGTLYGEMLNEDHQQDNGEYGLQMGYEHNEGMWSRSEGAMSGKVEEETAIKREGW